LQAAIERLGHACTVAADGDEAWAACRETAPQVVVTDWDMPGLDGAELCRRIRGELPGAYTYVIVLTGNADRDDARHTMQAGADDLLYKPLDAAELERKLIAAGRVTTLHRERRRAEELFRVQHEVTRVLAESAGLEDAIPRLLAAVATGIGWEVGAYWRQDPLSGVLHAGDVWTSQQARYGPCVEATAEATLDPGDCLPGRTLFERRPVWVADAGALAGLPRAEAAAAAGLHGALAFPVVSAEGAIGALEFYTGSRGERPDGQLLALLATAGRQIGQFVERKEDERRTERLKDEFFALVSHELRTPLTSICGYLELLREDEPDPDRQRFLGVMDRNAQRLQRLVGDLLFAAQVELGRLTLNACTVDLHTVVATAVEAARPRADHQKTKLVARLEPVPPVAGDPDRLGQAVDNLLSNAIKYTPPDGQIEVTLTASPTGAVIEISDTGLGIPEDQRARLFDRFFRAPDAVERAIPGVGLGLTIVKAIVEGHGGTISLTSEEGRGSSFRIELPVPARDAGTIATPTTGV
jgi:signal transduction histidine kinase